MSNFVLFMSVTVGGAFLEVGVSKLIFVLKKEHYKQHHFSFSKYLFYLLMPATAVVVIWLRLNDRSIFWVFLTFAVVGTFLEWLIGFTYHQVVGARLWTYHKYAISSYTSLLSIPLWGFGGVMFWLLSKMFI